MKRNTFNRRLLLHVLSEQLPDCGDNPPYSVSSIHYALQQAFQNWGGIYQEMKTIPSIIQIHRTIRDLRHNSLIVGNRVLEEGYGNNSLPKWVVRYQLADDVNINAIRAECLRVYNQVKKAKYGFNLFGSTFGQGLPACEVKPLFDRVKSLMQRTHPDKESGFDEQFQQMKQCRDWIKAGIPEPNSTDTPSDTYITKSDHTNTAPAQDTIG